MVIDNLSPFTPDILACLDKLGSRYTYKKYWESTQNDIEKCSRVILSGRRRNVQAINSANSRIIKYCHDNDLPLLGICYGAEIIALTLGGSIRRMASHIQSQIDVVNTVPNALVSRRGTISVYESHGFCIARLPQDFVHLADSKYCRFEVFAHRTKKIFGTQFHPEKSGLDGLSILENFVKIQ